MTVENKGKSSFRFDNDAPEYDSFIVKVIPYYNFLIEELITAIPFDGEERINVLDIGIGTGQVTSRFIKKYKYASVTGLDISDEMMKVAKKKFSNHTSPLSFLIQKIEDLNLRGKYDCIYSCLTLHHIKDDLQKKHCYEKIFDSLEEGGFFVNGDVIAGENEEENKLYRDNLRSFLRKNLQSEKEIDVWMNRHLDNDFPAPLSKHLHWLNETGFRNVKVFRKKMNYAVFGAEKK